MKKRALSLFLALTGGGFGMDVYLPVEKGALEIRAGYGYEWLTGLYDDDGDYSSWSDFGFFPDGYRPAAHVFPFQIKYGIGAGVDLEAEWAAAFSNEDAGDGQGMAQPSIGVKYVPPGQGVGLFSNLRLPVATGDFDDGDLSTTIEVGGLIRQRFTRVRFTGLVAYVNDFEGEDGMHLLAQPEIFVHPDVGVYLGLEAVMASEGGQSAHLLLLKPGVHAEISETLKMDGSFAVPLSGKNSPAVWQLRANFYVTLRP